MGSQDEYRRTTFRLPPGMYEEVRKVARQGDRSANAQMIKFIREGLERHYAGEWGGAPMSVGDQVGAYARSLSGEPVPAGGVELEYIQRAVELVEEAARSLRLDLEPRELAEWVALLYGIKRMAPTFEWETLGEQVRREMREWQAKGRQQGGGEGGHDVPGTPGNGTW
ncbi:MAG: Arc family DNA-binding protein [Thiohalorhabdus sp.]|uniref:Arc family DNA-binding protein n=1 Tax=Thiohalorhabdus sp. TaxID=3094134 RepID=UPI00397F7992